MIHREQHVVKGPVALCVSMGESLDEVDQAVGWEFGLREAYGGRHAHRRKRLGRLKQNQWEPTAWIEMTASLEMP